MILDTPTKAEPARNTRVHWATLEEDELGGEIIARKNQYFEQMHRSGLAARIRRSHREYYSMTVEGRYMEGGVQLAGEQGELVSLGANHFRSLIQHIHTMTTSHRPSYDPVATNMDVISLEQTTLARSVLEHYMRRKGFETKYQRAAEVSLWAGRAYMHFSWDQGLGPSVTRKEPISDPETGIETEVEVVGKAGDVRADVLGPFDVAKDPDTSWDDSPWCILCLPVNRYDLATQFPEHEDKILAAETGHNTWKRQSLNWDPSRERFQRERLFLYVLYHEGTPAVPNGRVAYVLEDGTVLLANDMPYSRRPVVDLCPGEVFGTSDGYTSAWDLLGLKEMADGVLSAASSNYDAFGVQNIVMEDGCDINPADLHGGLNVLRVPRGTTIEPRGINLTAMPQGWEKFYELLRGEQETIIGMNRTARGDPDPNLKSASAVAFVHGMAVQFQNSFQSGYIRLLEAGGSLTIECNQKWADQEQLVQIVGQNNEALIKNWVGQTDLDRIERVQIDVGNPMTRTLAGRMDLFEKYLEMRQQGVPPEDFDRGVQVLATGRIEPMSERSQKEMLNIRHENDLLRRKPLVQEVPKKPDEPPGPPKLRVQGVPANFGDHHKLHIQEHLAILSESAYRLDVDVVKAVQAHVMEHIDLWRFTEPAILMATGQEPLPFVGVPGMPMPGQEGPTGPDGPPKPGGPQGSPEKHGTEPDKKAGPQAPKPPDNPAGGGKIPFPAQQ